MKREKKLLSLRLLVCFLMGLMLVAFLAIISTIVYASMSTLLVKAEDSYVEEQLRAVESTLSVLEKRTAAIAADIAGWEQTRDFLAGHGDTYSRPHWADTAFLDTYQFHFVYLKDADGRDLYVDFWDYTDSRALQEPPGLSGHLNRYAQQALLAQDGVHGLLFYEGEPYLLAAVPVAADGGTGLAGGTLVLGSIVSDEHLQVITHLPDMSFSFLPADGQAQAMGMLRRGSERVSVYLPVEDMDGNPASLCVSTPREVYASGLTTIRLSSLLFAVCVIAFVAVLYLAIVRLVLHPIERLSDHISLNGQDIGPFYEQEHVRSLEFHALCSSISSMVDNIKQSNISMNAFKGILDQVDAYIYVSDPDTYEILFANKLSMETMSMAEKDCELPCWKAFNRDADGPCDFCPLPKLKGSPGLVDRWEFYNHHEDRYYQNYDWMIDWSDDRKVHLHYGVNISQIKQSELELQRQLDRQILMSSISQSFILSTGSFGLIREALQKTGAFIDVSDMIIGTINYETHMLNRQHVWSSDSGRLPPLQVVDTPFAPGDILYDAFVARQEPYLKGNDASQMPDFVYLDSMDVKAFMVVPVFLSGQLWGVISAYDRRSVRSWDESDVYFTRIIGGVISELLTRAETETELKRMSSIVDSSPLFIAYTHYDGTPDYLNDGALEISGYSQEELRAQGLGILLSPEWLARIRDEIFPKAAQGGQASIEMPLIRKDGQVRTLLYSIFQTGFRDLDPDLGFGIIGSDITEMRRLEQELTDAKEAAEQSNRAKSDFLSRMSHEMRTPMNAIIGMTSIAQASGDIERKDYCLEKIGKASNHLLGVINDILDMSKIEANKFELSYSDFNFEKMLIRVTNVVHFLIEEKEQSMLIKVSPEIPAYIVSDEQRLAQVITNLLSNAVKFTPKEGKITLSAYLVEEVDGLCTLRVEVSDTGIGISPEQQGRLFHSFEQGDGGISRRFGGTGLGLVICKNIVEMMSGEIWVDSKAGAGSTFSFTIKVRRGVHTVPPLLDSSVNWRNLRILIVDDSSDVCEHFLEVAHSLGIQCDAASSGPQALELLEQSKDDLYNIIFVDWRMPHMNGIELTGRIKELYGDQPIVIMTSSTEWAYIEDEAKDVGIQRFLPKPLFSSVIADCINECLSSHAEPVLNTEEEEALENCFVGNRILLAEDVEINQEILIALLQPTGIEIDCVNNGHEAFDTFARSPLRYDLILMDIHMPEVNGYEATKMIRELKAPHAAQIPILALTANVFREDIERCLAAGMDDHIGKPLDIGEVVEKLKTYLPPKQDA